MTTCLRIVSTVALGLAAMLVTSGCASTRPDLPPQAKSGLQTIATSLEEGKTQLIATIDKLKVLEKQGVDAATASKEYIASLRKLDDAIGRTRAGMKSAENPDAFFQSWSSDLKTISDTQLREAGQQRYAQARSDLEKLNEKIESLRDSFKPFHKDLEDIGTYLTNDPTTSGVDQVRPVIRRVMGSYSSVMKKVDSVQSSLAALMK